MSRNNRGRVVAAETRFARQEIRWRLDQLGFGLVMWGAGTLSGYLFATGKAQFVFALSLTAVVILAVVLWRRRTRARLAEAQIHPSVPALWNAYLLESGQAPSTPMPAAWHFCDNERDANECARLALAGRKRATTPSLWYFEMHQLPVPAVGDLDIVTNWDGIAQCVIRTTAVSIVKFCDITAEYAQLEGEGDRSLISWRAAHWGYYRRELLGTRYDPQEDMPLVCQQFEVIFPSRDHGHHDSHR